MGAFPNLSRNDPFCPRLSSFVLLGAQNGDKPGQKRTNGDKTGHFGTNWETRPFSIYPHLALLKKKQRNYFRGDCDTSAQSITQKNYFLRSYVNFAQLNMEEWKSLRSLQPPVTQNNSCGVHFLVITSFYRSRPPKLHKIFSGQIIFVFFFCGGGGVYCISYTRTSEGLMLWQSGLCADILTPCLYWPLGATSMHIDMYIHLCFISETPSLYISLHLFIYRYMRLCTPRHKTNTCRKKILGN